MSENKRPHSLLDGVGRPLPDLFALLQRGIDATPTARHQAPATGRICTGVLLRVGRFRPPCREAARDSESSEGAFCVSPLYSNSDSDEDEDDEGEARVQHGGLAEAERDGPPAPRSDPPIQI